MRTRRPQCQTRPRGLPAARGARHASGARPAGGAEVGAAPVSDANLTLEVLPFAKLRAGGTNARFRSWPHISPREAQRDPAALGCADPAAAVGMARRESHGVETPQPQLYRQPVDRDARRRSAPLQKIGAALMPWHRAETLGFEIAEALARQTPCPGPSASSPSATSSGAWVVIEDFSFDSQVLRCCAPRRCGW